LKIFNVPAQYCRGTSNRVLLQAHGKGWLPHPIWRVITTTVVPRRADRPRVALRTPPCRHRPPPNFPLLLLSPMPLSLCGVFYHSRRFYHTAAAPAPSATATTPAAARRPLPRRHRCSPA